MRSTKFARRLWPVAATTPRAVQDPNWHDERRRSNAVIGASNCSSHVRAVTMTVLRPVSVTDSREPCGNSTHQFAVGRTHAGVDHVHGYTSTRLGSGVPSVEWQVALINAIETPRKRGHTFGGLTLRRDRIRCRRGVAGASTIRGTDDKGVGSSVGEPSDLASEGTRSDAGATTWRSCCGVGRNCRATITFWRRPIHRGASVTCNGAHVARWRRWRQLDADRHPRVRTQDHRWRQWRRFQRNHRMTPMAQVVARPWQPIDAGTKLTADAP
mgnify:CR=1 FL=1